MQVSLFTNPVTRARYKGAIASAATPCFGAVNGNGNKRPPETFLEVFSKGRETSFLRKQGISSFDDMQRQLTGINSQTSADWFVIANAIRYADTVLWPIAEKIYKSIAENRDSSVQDRARALAGRAKIYNRLGHSNRALHFVQQAHELDPDSPYIISWYANFLHFRLKDTLNAMELSRLLLDRSSIPYKAATNEQKALAYMILGYGYQKLNRPDDASFAFQRAHSLSPVKGRGSKKQERINLHAGLKTLRAGAKAARDAVKRRSR